MPLYDYQCECGLRFERQGVASKAMDSQECPCCSEQAPRIAPDSVNYTFNQSPTQSGPVPQNTGVSSYDYNVDRIVGAEAKERWQAVEKREALKRGVVHDTPGATKQDLSVLPDGNYRVMKPEEKRTTRNTRAFHNLVTGLEKSKDRYALLQKVGNSSSEEVKG